MIKLGVAGQLQIGPNSCLWLHQLAFVLVHAMMVHDRYRNGFEPFEPVHVCMGFRHRFQLQTHVWVSGIGFSYRHMYGFQA